MTSHSVDLNFVIGEDYSAYLYWTDEYGDPVITDTTATAKLQVANAVGGILMTFLSTANTTTEAAIVVLSGGYIRITCPRAVTNGIVAGSYKYDLHVDSLNVQVNPFSGKQRRFFLTGTASFVKPATIFTPA